ncbi:hypothetical protein [Tenacibaculum insulae]|uniref:hypothetical protein n=1 Tax=Tenacibaculum insulae TaxID=2029677 RepID=UPI003AB63BEB
MKTITNKFKLALVAVGILTIGTVSAQQTSGTYTAVEKVGKSSELNGTIRVIDNKGTKKYLQVKNGLTLLTDQTPDGGIVSTWQLGGTLTDNTYITASATGGAGGTPAEFALDGLELVTDATTASTDASDRSIHGTGTGFTVLLRNEVSGAVQKIKLSDLLNVQADHSEVTVTALNSADLQDNTATATTGIEIDIEASRTNIQVYRNGVKLRALVDYNIKTVDDAGTDRFFVFLIENTTAPNDWELYNDDIIEVHAIK